MSNPLPTIHYPKSKILILVLLCLNAVIYGMVDTLTSTLDAISWLVLLILYELESHGNRMSIKAKTLEWLRNGLIALIAGVFFSYLQDSEWLDVCNDLLWFALIALMELEVRRPDIMLRHANVFWLLTLTVFCGLLAMAGIWLWQKAWLDAYDALLWIAAFGFIEADILQLLKRKQA